MKAKVLSHLAGAGQAGLWEQKLSQKPGAAGMNAVILHGTWVMNENKTAEIKQPF